MTRSIRSRVIAAALTFGAVAGLAAPATAAPPAFNEFVIPTATSAPYDITVGPDGALWFTEFNGHKIGRMTTDGQFSEVDLTAGHGPRGITGGTDGNLWFADRTAGQITRMTPSGTLTNYAVGPTSNPEDVAEGLDRIWFTLDGMNSIGSIDASGVVKKWAIFTASSHPAGITKGPDDAMWFTESFGNKIGRIDANGAMKEYPLPDANSGPRGIALGPDRALWFTEANHSKIGRLTPNGALTEYSVPTPGAGPAGIVAGPDGAMWFTEESSSHIGRIAMDGTVREYDIPTASPTPRGIVAGLDGAMWFVESGLNANRIGRATMPTPDPVPATGPTVTPAPPAPPARPVDAVAPMVKLPQQSLKMSSLGTVAVKVYCPAAEVACAAVVRLDSIKFKRRLGKKTAAIPGGHWATVRIKLSRKHRATLRKFGSLRVKLTVTAVDAAGNRKTRHRTLTLRAR